MAELNAGWNRSFDVYDRIDKLGIDLMSKGEVLPAPKGRRICNLTFTPSGLVFTSGTGAGRGAVTNDDGDVPVAPWPASTCLDTPSSNRR